MKLLWHIEKKRGNFRPVLTYRVELDDWERELATPALRIDSSIPEPVRSWQDHCYPGELERGDEPPTSCYPLEIPPHKGRFGSTSLRLPWRADNRYPEVEASFEALREAYETALAAARASEPMNERGSLRLSGASLRAAAPAILAARLLGDAGAVR